MSGFVENYWPSPPPSPHRENDNNDKDASKEDPGEVIIIKPIKCDGRTAVDQKYPARPVAQIRYDKESNRYHIRLDDPNNPSFWAEVIFAGCDK